MALSRFTLGPGATASEEVLLRQPHGEFTDHNGGNLGFATSPSVSATAVVRETRCAAVRT
ncbi:hypothetical protein FHX42_003828 [Saccharopolyspora lacisalsi]|uniref:Uncharacterized protein n=1 Tax=Halosaccharopolyspora lacisalsi TaxID=1000566 RepID=A0A839DWV4_9PSEU|nr:hypothetical protein [Halosaccharopolyspora lacisalsi]MBA8826452.1 hypothetical protein [Halosaccharopolyspora lacisalsi]